ncbi:SxtJ family membrane protein [Mucilaginibacter sp.]
MTEAELQKQNRKFGYTIAAALAVLSLFNIIIKHRTHWWGAFIISTILVQFATVKPLWLNPMRLIWDKIGHILGTINTYILLTVFYFLILSPLGMLMRLFGKDILKVKWVKNKNSYWESTADKADSSMSNQF